MGKNTFFKSVHKLPHVKIFSLIFDSFCLLKIVWSKWNLEHFFSTEIDKKSGTSMLPLFLNLDARFLLKRQ